MGGACFAQVSFNPARSLDRAAVMHPQRPSVHYGGQHWTVRESALITRALAVFLQRQGIGTGDRVAVIARNSPYHLFLHVACARIGAVTVPLSHRLSGAELERLFAVCRPKMAVADPETVNANLILRAYASSVQDLRLCVIDNDPQARQTDPLPARRFIPISAADEYLQTAEKEFSASFMTADSPGSVLNRGSYPEGLGAILFTSASTGNAKAVGLTHEQMWWGSQNFRDGFEYSVADTELVTAPLTHIGGFNGTTMDLFSSGGTVVIVREFDPGTVLESLQKYRVAMMFGVPTIYAALMNHPDFPHTDLSSFRLALIGGAVCAPALLRRMRAHGLRPVNVWGMTETSGSGFCLSADDPGLGSVGRPFAHIQARLVDPGTGLDSSRGEGELALRGPSVITRYWQDPQTTAELIPDGWLRTGDLARLDGRGMLWIVGRVHNVINTGGEKVSPEEVTQVLSAMPGLSDVAVFGVPDSKWGEKVVCAAVMRSGCAPVSQEDVYAFLDSKIAHYKIPKQVLCLEELPLTANGKVDFTRLREVFARL